MNSDELNKRLINFEHVEPSGPASEAIIAAAEHQLGIKFPPQYRCFLSAFGCGGVDSEDFIGLGGPDCFDIVKLSAKLRDKKNQLPHNLLPIRGDGFGNYDCFDTSMPTANGEFAIVQWNHEGAGGQTCELLANSFDLWFESILLMIEGNQ